MSIVPVDVRSGNKHIRCADRVSKGGGAPQHVIVNVRITKHWHESRNLNTRIGTMREHARRVTKKHLATN